jgi:hypothetical protein
MAGNKEKRDKEQIKYSIKMNEKAVADMRN